MKEIIQYISIYSTFLPILVFFVFQFNRKQKLKWVIFLLLVLSVLVDVLSLKMANSGRNNIWLVSIFTLIEFSVLSFFFSHLIKRKRTQKVILLVLFLFSIFWIIQNFFIGSINKYDYLSQTIEFLFLLLYCLLYFFEKSKITENIFIYNTYQFWLISAILIYCAGTFFSFFTPINTSDKNTDVVIFEYISRFGSIIKNILITIAFCINPDKLLKNQPNKNSMYYIKDLKV